MDEREYRNTYHEMNELRCKFEKSILSRQTMCEHAHRFNLADREGVACQHAPSNALCETLLNQLRESAIFALKLTKLEGPLPHAKEVKVQTGGILGLNSITSNEDTQEQNIENIAALIQLAIEKYGGLANLPYDEITRKIVQYEVRNKRQRK